MLAFFVAGFHAAAPPALAVEALPVLTRVGPWPEAARMAFFNGRLWFANAVKGRNHNSADIYSLGPDAGDLRYERHLFSQDAGKPAVYRGRLYWPFEDSRFSLGWGHYAVTDGQKWQVGTIPGAEIYHVHAMAGFEGELLAATSAWRAGLQRSADGGLTWEVLYDHPTPARRVSRITSLSAGDNDLLLPLWMRGQSQLLTARDDRISPLPAWTEGTIAEAVAVLKGQMVAVVAEGGKGTLRRLGRDGETQGDIDIAGNARDVATDGRGYWALSAEGEGGRVWRSPDGLAWEAVYELAGGTPRELLVGDSGVFVSGAGDDGRGVIWGRPWGDLPAGRPAPLAAPSRAPAADMNWRDEGDRLATLLADLENYAGHGEPLRDAVYRLARLGPPPDFFTGLLDTEMPGDEISLVGGAARVPAGHLGRWILFWGMGLAGSGQIPVGYLEPPWSEPPNRAEKYFQPLLAALVAVERVGQNDRVTIDALVQRLSDEGDPLWLTGDVVGVLSSLTGQRFGYDRTAWRAWWRGAAET